MPFHVQYGFDCRADARAEFWTILENGKNANHFEKQKDGYFKVVQQKNPQITQAKKDILEGNKSRGDT